MSESFLEITVIVVVAAVFAVVFKILKQPPILAYIFTGIVFGVSGLVNFGDTDLLHSLSKIGITLLLFMLGLEIHLSELRTVGKIAIITGIGQIVFTFLLGFIICRLIGFSTIASIYAAVALTFSSTIIIVKLLSDKKDLNSLYGKISVGFLLVQDFFAILALILLTSLNTVSGGIELLDLFIIFLKIIVLFGGAIYLSQSIFPKLVHRLADSQEILLLASLAWALGLAAFASSEFIGFSVEIGGFLAGLTLANSTESFQIATKIRSIRDFFIMLFFVLLGMELQFANMAPAIPSAIILSIFVLIGNPFIVMIILGALGYTKRTSFLAGLTVAQISEFSLIVIILGNSLGHVPDNVVAVITLVGIITFTLSTYAILNGDWLFSKLGPYLSIFERKHLGKGELQADTDLENHIVLIGAHRLGQAFIKDLKNYNQKLVVVDYDPAIVDKLTKKGIEVVYGDIADNDIQDKVQLDKAKMVISSLPDVENNLIFLSRAKQIKPKPMIIIIARFKENVKLLKDSGADYVILPYEIVGKTLAKAVATGNFSMLKSPKKDIKQSLAETFAS